LVISIYRDRKINGRKALRKRQNRLSCADLRDFPP
jgi:hypothetical protein